jgi:hypothetical protein
MNQHFLASLGQRLSLSGLFEQGTSDKLFKASDPPGNRGTVNAQLHSGTCELASADNREKNLKVAPIQ